MYKAALFDLDGVVVDTESQYTKFWGGVGKHYFPSDLDFAQRIKGSTLIQIYDKYFAGRTADQNDITEALDEYESQMDYSFISGFEPFVLSLRDKGVRMAVVTSSNIAKMKDVYKAHPDFQSLFDAILTSEDFEKSKPDPDCYLKAAARFNLEPQACVGFEDSINGLKAVKAADMFCVGLATTNPADKVAEYADKVVKDYNKENNLIGLFV